MTADDLKAGALRSLSNIDLLTPATRQEWDSDTVRQLAVMKLWIDAGNYAEAYRLAQDVAKGVYPWSNLVGLRHVLAHQLPETIKHDELWADLSEVRGLLADVVRANPYLDE